MKTASVPCGSCNACCRFYEVISLTAKEAKSGLYKNVVKQNTLHREASGLKWAMFCPDLVCPMLVDNRCSVYENRPRTCREFDCRKKITVTPIPDSKLQPISNVRQPDLDTRAERKKVADHYAVAYVAAELLKELDSQPPNESQ